MWVKGSLHKSTALHNQYTNALELWMKKNSGASFQQFFNEATRLANKMFR